MYIMYVGVNKANGHTASSGWYIWLKTDHMTSNIKIQNIISKYDVDLIANILTGVFN